ncbi:uncharacterized protein C15orf39 homolog [Antennarius striatus]|uniref:uncharacterized protein C15orf39 homolog n=1 Tax=Antennarius striatus TaxID=241820 RepID=UPI0035B48980
MMSNQMMQTLINPAFQSKMQLFDGTIASVGQSKPKNMSDYLGKQMLQYNRTYLTYDTRGKDRTQLSPSYNNLKASLVDGRSPVSQLSGMERENRLIYRQDDSPEERQPHSSSLHHAPEKQGFKLYNKSPAISSPPAVNPEAVAKKKREVDSSSQSSNNSIYLAIPKPVYGHNPCCDNLGCVIGQRYSMEPGSQRIPNTMYEHEWMKAGVHYNEKPPIQTNKDVLLQQSGLQFEPSVDQMKRIPVETYSPDRARTLPTLIEPSYTSYPCPLTPTLFGSFTEQSSRNSSRGYPNFYPSHHTYEHMTSEFYQEHSPMSKYGHLTQHPVFYYTQADVEVESSTPCKDVGSKQRGDVPVFLNHTVSNPREHYMVPQSLHGEIRLPLARAEALQNHPLKQGFSYPCFAYPRINLNASQIRRPTKRQQTLPILNSKYINVSPSSQCIEHPITSATNLHKDKPSNILPVSAHCNLPVLHVEQVSPARRQSQRGLSPSVLQMKRFPSPLSSLHIEQPVPPSPVLNTDRYLDYSASEAQLRSPKHSKSFPVSPTARQEMSPCVDSDPAYLTLYKNSNAPKNIYFPAFAPPKNPFGPTSIPSFTVPKESPKRSLSHSSPPVKIKEEDKDLYEVELVKKRQKLEMENAQEAKTTDSPPMPVINNVFSLAPYHAYLQASAMLLASRMCETTSQSSEHCEVKTKPDDKDKEEDQEAEDPIVCQDSKEICANATLEKTKVEIVTPKNIKVEKEDSSDTCDPAKSPVSLKAHNKVEIKKEPDETCLSNEEHMLVIKKYEPDELESLPLLTPKQERSDEVELEEMTERMNSSPQGDTNMLHDEMCIIQPKSVTPLRPPEHKLNFKNIPPQCLKLSAYKLFLRHTTHSGPDPPLEKPDPQLTAECSPKQDVQIPVRKHFFEIHQSLHQLISKSVSASSENELRAWLSQLALTDPASSSTKIQKVSCLLGVKARETWINEEIKSALHMLLERLREYIAQERCPFPHVMRTRTVFLPMLVVKEMMFPMVQGSFIDQVLQEHKVELRPTTLSEEKILIQLCKRACSSRLMRLMSLKHLPDIYLDVVNISYYTCVCRHLESASPDVQKRFQD